MSEEGGEEAITRPVKSELQTTYKVHYKALRGTLDLANLLDRPDFFDEDPEKRTPLTSEDLAQWPSLQEKFEQRAREFSQKEEEGLIAEKDRERLFYQTVVEPFNPRRANAVTKIFSAASDFVDIEDESVTAYKVTEFKEETIGFARERLGDEEYKRYVEEYRRLREVASRKKSPVGADQLGEAKEGGEEISELEEQQKLDYASRAKRVPYTEEEIGDVYKFGEKTMEIFKAIGETLPAPEEQ